MKTNCISFLFFLFLLLSACHHPENDKTNALEDVLKSVKTKEARFNILNDSIQRFNRDHKTVLKYLSLKSSYFNYYKEYDSALVTAENQLQIAKTDNNINRLLEAYYKKGRYNRKLNRINESIIYFDSCLVKAKEVQDVSYEAKANTNLGSIYKSRGSLERSFYHYNESFNNYRFLKDSSRTAGKLLEMANIQNIIGDFSGSLETAIEGRKYAETQNNSRTKLALYQTITTAYRELDRFEDAMEYSDRVLLLIQDSIQSKNLSKTVISICKNTRGNLLADQQKYSEAIAVYQDILADTGLSLRERNRSKDNLGYTLWLQDKSNSDAKIILEETMNSRLKQKDYVGLIASNIHLVQYYSNSDDKLALKHAQDALSYAKKMNSLYAQKEALGYIIEIKDDPFNESKEYKRISSQLDKLQQDTRDIYVGSRFLNDELKEENFRLEITNANQRSNIILSISILIFIVLASIALVLFQRSKHKRDKIEAIIDQTHKTEVQISQKVHDELANDMADTLQFIQQHSKIATTTKDLLAPKLDSLYERTRDIATEISSFDLAEFTSSLRSLIIQYHMPGVQVITNIGLETVMNELPNHKKTNVYRCIQELLINTKKHSEASELRVIFRNKKNLFIIEYSDNGKGCNLDTISKRGLKNVESRIRDIGGTLTFKSSIGEGFQATLKFKSS